MLLQILGATSLGAGLLLGPRVLRSAAALNRLRLATALRLCVTVLFPVLAILVVRRMWVAYSPPHAFILLSGALFTFVWSPTSSGTDVRSASRQIPHLIAAGLLVGVVGTEAFLANSRAGGPARGMPAICDAIGGPHGEAARDPTAPFPVIELRATLRAMPATPARRGWRGKM